MDTSYCSEILAQSTAVRTNVLNDVKTAVEPLKCDLDGVLQYSTSIVEWLKPIVDLKDYYVYPTNGITEGLNWWMAKETRSIYMDNGDYQWVKPSFKENEQIKYISIPSAIDGNYRDIDSNTVALDLAYVGSTKVKKIDLPKNTDYVFYSLSKPFGVRNVRTGWFFTREPDQRLEAITHNAKYYNYYALQIAETIINNFDIDYVYNTLHKKQIEVCDKYDFVPSDSVWIATTKNSAYDKFKRGDVNRLCLAPCY